MFLSVLDTLPTEVVLLVVDNLGPKDLQSLLHVIHWLPGLLTRQQATITSSDENGNTILHILAENGEAELIKPLLLKCNLDPDPRDSSGQTPFACAARNGQKEMVEMLLTIDSIDLNPVDEDGMTPLLWAAGNGHKEIVKMLLATDGIDHNRADINGRTPLL
jgi:ankyrin repeat protein